MKGGSGAPFESTSKSYFVGDTMVPNIEQDSILLLKF